MNVAELRRWVMLIDRSESTLNTGDLGADFEYYDHESIQQVISEMRAKITDMIRDEVREECRA